LSGGQLSRVVDISRATVPVIANALLSVPQLDLDICVLHVHLVSSARGVPGAPRSP